MSNTSFVRGLKQLIEGRACTHAAPPTQAFHQHGKPKLNRK